jgi:hypothetical protein
MASPISALRAFTQGPHRCVAPWAPAPFSSNIGDVEDWGPAHSITTSPTTLMKQPIRLASQFGWRLCRAAHRELLRRGGNGEHNTRLTPAFCVWCDRMADANGNGKGPPPEDESSDDEFGPSMAKPGEVWSRAPGV